jgi:hypothetical protein
MVRDWCGAEPVGRFDKLLALRAEPRHVGRGGWYTLQFAPGGLAVTPHDPVPAMRSREMS